MDAEAGTKPPDQLWHPRYNAQFAAAFFDAGAQGSQGWAASSQSQRHWEGVRLPYAPWTMSVRVGVSSRVVFSLINCANEYGVAGRTELAQST
jgi:hypothetical protein